jgi:hypothetical protein
MNLPGKSVGKCFSSVHPPESSIPVLGDESGPVPTAIAFYDFRPKPLQWWDFLAKDYFRHIGLLFSSLCSGLAVVLSCCLPDLTTAEHPFNNFPRTVAYA